mmetsp:Transcript_53303/g.125259  ORF Transcript_53303/g.125259 Transcript_53303/m.125259 type:complete len:315 (-) Transcript_53303:5901-6845(-)
MPNMALGLAHQADEAVEQVGDVMRAGAGFRVPLEAERRLVSAGDALQRAVEQADVSGAQVGRQRVGVHRETVVLAGDADAATVQVLDRMVGAVVAELHLEGLGARGQRQDLMPEADAKDRYAGLDQLGGRLDRVVAGLRVTRAVGQEHAIRLQPEDFAGRRLGGHDGHLAAALGQHAQDVVLDPEVVGHDVELRRGLRAVAAAELPFGLRPGLHLGTADDLGKVETSHRGRSLRSGQRLIDVGLGHGFSRRQSQDAAVLGAGGAQHAGQAPGVQAGDGHRALFAQIGIQRLARAEVGRTDRQILDHQAGRKHLS